MAQQTAVEWFYQRILAEDIKEVFEQAKAMEKEQSEKYAEFCIRCDRGGIKLLDFNDYIKL